MTLAFIFWFVLLVWALFSSYVAWGRPPADVRWGYAPSLLIFIALVLLGLKVFGSPLQGG